ncbi:MAG: FkbM family methyltransferase [Phycisphaerales bacterium]|jgi:FkbM family methyltransferase|nr:FkbM family methyltransferase [Phycisphaerales bacterium]
MMDRVTTFNKLRSALAPAVRPILEYVPPVRWAAMWWLGRRQPSEVVVDGLAYAVHPADFGVTFEIARTGDYEPATRSACLELLEPGMTFVDIGAHVGLFAVPAAMAVGPEGHVHAFEPDPDNRALLERNVARHTCGNVEVHPEAVAAAPGSLTLARSRYNTGDHRLVEGPSRGGVSVDVIALAPWLATRGITPDVIKMDVQGAEPLVIRGMSDFLEGDLALALLMEFAPAMLRSAGTDPSNLLADLVSHGFDLELIDERTGLRSQASVADIMSACPAHGYVNLLARRGGQ